MNSNAIITLIPITEILEEEKMENIIGKGMSKVFFYYFFSLGYYYFSAGYWYCKKIYASLFDEFDMFYRRFFPGRKFCLCSNL